MIVVELDDVVPRRDKRKPNLYVSKSVTPPEQRFDAMKKSKKIHWYTGHMVRLRPDLSPARSYNSAEGASSAYSRLTRRLTSAGYTVNRNTQVWTVYVVELDSSAIKDPGNGYVYVGETSRTPEERLKQHLTGARNKRGRLYSSVVRNHGIRLRPDLAQRKKFFDQASAKRGEREHFELLKSKGFKVKGGH